MFHIWLIVYQDGEIHRALLITAMKVPARELPPATAPMAEMAEGLFKRCGVCAECISPKAMIEVFIHNLYPDANDFAVLC